MGSLIALIVLRETKIASEMFFASLYDESDMARRRAIRAWLHFGANRASGLPSVTSDALEVAMKTQGEIEGAICQGMSRFEQEYMGRGPRDIRTHLIDDLVVVRLHSRAS